MQPLLAGFVAPKFRRKLANIIKILKYLSFRNTKNSKKSILMAQNLFYVLID